MTNLELDDWSPHFNLDFQFANMKRRLFLPDFFCTKDSWQQWWWLLYSSPRAISNWSPFQHQPNEHLEESHPSGWKNINHHWPSLTIDDINMMIWWWYPVFPCFSWFKHELTLKPAIYLVYWWPINCSLFIRSTLEEVSVPCLLRHLHGCHLRPERRTSHPHFFPLNMSRSSTQPRFLGWYLTLGYIRVMESGTTFLKPTIHGEIWLANIWCFSGKEMD